MPHHHGNPATNPTATPPSDDEIRRLGQMISWSTYVIAAIVIVFSAITATGFVARHDTPQWGSPLIGVATDVAFVMSLSADGFLARHGLPDPGIWPRLLRWVTGASSIFLNDGTAINAGDYQAVVIHTIAPALLLLLAEAAPAYRRAFALSQAPNTEPATDVTEQPIIPEHFEAMIAKIENFLAAQTAPVEVTPVTDPEMTEDDDDDDFDAPFETSIDWTAKPDAEEAKKIIEQGWRTGDKVTDVARLVQRDKSYVSRRFTRLTEMYGPRSTVGV